MYRRARVQIPLFGLLLLPLRLEAATVAVIDEGWRECGMKTRMEFLRRALTHYLEHLGAREVAARVESGSAA